MNVLIVTPYSSFGGGAESVNGMLSRVFEEAGHHVSYLTSDAHHNYRMKILKRVLGLPAVTAMRFKKCLASEFDLVLANGEFGLGIDHPNAVCIFHGSYAGFRDNLRPVLTARQRASMTWLATLQKAAAAGKYVVSVSSYLEKILDRNGIKVSRTIPNAVDTDAFKPLPGEGNGRYLFVGRYHRFGKGFDILEALASRGLSIDCATDCDPGRGLGFLGMVPYRDMPDLYRRYRMLIFPSRFESGPLAALEAMSCGLPVVMSNVGYGEEIRKEIPEFVVDFQSDNLAQTFERRISAVEQRHSELASAARAYVLRHHSFDRFADSWLTLAAERSRC